MPDEPQPATISQQIEAIDIAARRLTQDKPLRISDRERWTLYRRLQAAAETLRTLEFMREAAR